MRKLLLASVTAATVVLGGAAPGTAALVQYDITGTGSGVLNGTAFNDVSFDIQLVGDNSSVSNGVIDPLVSANVILGGLGTAGLEIATRLGLSSGNHAVYFSQSVGMDLFDFYLSSSDAAAFAFQAGYGPVTGTNVFAFNQFQNIATDLGQLTFNSSSDVLFSSESSTGTIPTPEPASMALLGAGLAGLGLIRRRRA